MAGRVVGRAFGHDDHHALQGTREQHAVSVFQLGVPLWLVDTVPAAADTL
jgi:hypothetical protein